jgi:hypothetical protein
VKYTNILKASSDLTDLEISRIVDLFHLSFGTNLEPTSREHFNWKYLDNPFGDSFHLLTEDEGRLIASRAFWNVPVKAGHLQCVDTCVAPDYRGKGIFKETTMFALGNLENTFYNAPNSSSLPQYLKYGWKINTIYKPKLSSYRYIKPCVSELDLSDDNEKLINWKFLSHPDFVYKYFIDDEYSYLCRMKKSIPIILFKTKIDISRFVKIGKPWICATYSNFNGIGLEFSVLSHSVDNSDVALRVDPYFFDMF